MTDDELLLIYKGLRDMTEAMKAREIALDQKTAALSAAITQLGKLPDTLGKQTSQYIAMGVRQSIQDDFSRPIAEAVKGPIAEFNHATSYARDVMRQVGKESRFHTWNWMLSLFLVGLLTGVGCYHIYTMSKIDRISDRLNVIQQQIVPAAPTQDAKPGDGKAAKGKKGH
jgi:hypothetical protein